MKLISNLKGACIEKRRYIFIFIVISCFTASIFTGGMTAAAETDLEEGVYLIDYTVLQVDNDSVSIANDYFQKKAMLVVKNGTKQIQMTVNQSEWVQSLQVANGPSFVDVHVLSHDEQNNSRLVAFNVEQELTQPLLMKMHIRIDSMQPVYDHQYTVRFVHDVSSVEKTQISLSEISGIEQELEYSTNIQMLIYLIIVAAIIMAIIFAIRKNSKK